jgi:hypothetical protein
MMYRLFLCGAWMASVLSLWAAPTNLDFMTVGSTTYSNVTIFGANATDLFFTSDLGMSNVKLQFLSPELQREFNYNPTTAERIEQQRSDDDKRFQQNLAEALSARLQASHETEETQIRAHYSEAGLSDPVSDDSPIDKTAPELNFENWVGQPPNLTGKFAVISVWSPKSAACRKWIPQLNDLHKIFAGKIEVLGVTTASEADVQQSDPKIDFACALDPDGKFLKAAGVTSLPCVLLVDTNGTVRYEGHPAAVSTNTLQMLLKSPAE